MGFRINYGRYREIFGIPGFRVAPGYARVARNGDRIMPRISRDTTLAGRLLFVEELRAGTFLDNFGPDGIRVKPKNTAKGGLHA